MTKTSPNMLLLDVNILLALAIAWPNHQHHSAALRTVERNRDGWATCALTELGFIRSSSNPAAVVHAKTPAEAASLLAGMTAGSLHRYLDSLPSPLKI